MFPSIILEVYYMKKQEIGKKKWKYTGKNIASLGTRSRDSCGAAHRANRWTIETILYSTECYDHVLLFTCLDHYRVLIVEINSINDIQTGVHLWTLQIMNGLFVKNNSTSGIVATPWPIQILMPNSALVVGAMSYMFSIGQFRSIHTIPRDLSVTCCLPDALINQ